MSSSVELLEALPAGTATDSWKKSLTPELRARIAELHRLTLWTRAKILVLLAIWAVFALAAIHVDSLLVRVPCWIVIGLALHGLGVMMHEGAHGNLFHVGWLDRPVGFLCGLPVFFPCSSYRASHFLHHKYENTLRDPDNLAANFPNPVLRAMVFYTWFLIGMPAYIALVTVTGPFRARGIRERLACVIEPLLIAAFYFGLFSAAAHYHFGDLLINGWAWGLLFAVLIANFRGLAEHTQLPQQSPPDPLQSTRSVRSNGVISFFFSNQNYHLDHHLFTGVPWNNLSRINALLRPMYQDRRAAVVPGYWQWIVGAFRFGPNRSATYADGEPVWDPDRLVAPSGE